VLKAKILFSQVA